jgi:prolyl-tRNA editing enzyme YbaK/EbsC (Cys-tRNA(Pro) deacylase)
MASSAPASLTPVSVRSGVRSGVRSWAVPEVHPNVRRVQETLRACGSEAEVRQLADSTRTSAEAAAALGVEVGQIAKTIVFLADGEPVLVVASGADRIDTDALSRHLGGKEITRADADAVRSATGFPIGGVSPVALPPGLTILVEKRLADFDVLWTSGGTPHAVFPTTFAELVRITSGSTSEVSHR